MYGTPTYSSWSAMIGRCSGRTSKPEHYAAKGVRVCSEWLTFAGFFADMGVRPEGMTLDRIDNSLGYSKANCRWATSEQQAQNRSNSVLISFNGKTQTARAWSREIGVSDTAIRARLRKGWPVEMVLSSKDFHCNSGRWKNGPNPQ